MFHDLENIPLLSYTSRTKFGLTLYSDKAVLITYIVCCVCVCVCVCGLWASHKNYFFLSTEIESHKYKTPTTVVQILSYLHGTPSFLFHFPTNNQYNLGKMFVLICPL